MRRDNFNEIYLEKYEPKPGYRLRSITKKTLAVPFFIENKKTGKKEGVSFLSGFTAMLFENNIARPQISFGVDSRNLNDEEKEKSFWEAY